MSNPEPTKEYRGGLTWGRGYFRRFYVSFPFGKLRIDSKFLTFYALGSEFRFDRTEILGIEVKFALLAKGLRFIHQKAEYPPQIKFLTFQSDEILSVLSEIPQVSKQRTIRG